VSGGNWIERVILADDETERINGGYDEYPFGNTEFLTLHDQARVQTKADEGVSCNEQDPFRGLGSK
jgi:hypothetical protein